jgi:hypothetical protein
MAIYRQPSAHGGLNSAYAATSIGLQPSPSQSAAGDLAHALNPFGARGGAATQARIAWTGAALVCFRLLAIRLLTESIQRISTFVDAEFRAIPQQEQINSFIDIFQKWSRISVLV